MIKTDVTLCSGGYRAEFRSDMGGNCYRLFHIPTGSEIFRIPKDEEHLLREVYLLGNPILFPPNRIRGGEFEFRGATYRFPVNEPSTGCHIHGALYKTRFEIAEKRDDYVRFEYSAEAGEYLSFPHEFKLVREYTLDESGLLEAVTVHNISQRDMPFMLAFHTTFNVPFAEDTCADNCYMQVKVGREHIRDEKYLPTLEYVGGRARETALNEGGYPLANGALSAFYESLGSTSLVIDKKRGLAISYEATEDYKYRMLWQKAGTDFVVIEPQTCAIDCFHLEAPAEQKGLIVIPAGEKKTLKTKFAITKISE
ncbi:MAG: aldose 1-epimerase [Ruminococcaceae bacterium]|nr:aldose 1-epimerase [Oscillospiraceae bacterium]